MGLKINMWHSQNGTVLDSDYESIERYEDNVGDRLKGLNGHYHFKGLSHEIEMGCTWFGWIEYIIGENLWWFVKKLAFSCF